MRKSHPRAEELLSWADELLKGEELGEAEPFFSESLVFSESSSRVFGGGGALLSWGPQSAGRVSNHTSADEPAPVRPRSACCSNTDIP